MVTRVAAGLEPDQQAMTIVRRELLSVVATSFPLVDAEDVVQNALSRLVRTPPESVNAWAYLRNIARDEATRTLRSRAQATGFPPQEDVVDLEASEQEDRLLERDAAAATVLAALRVHIGADLPTTKIVTTWLSLAEELGRAPSTREVGAAASVSHTSVAQALSTFRDAIAASEEIHVPTPADTSGEFRIPAILGPDGTPLRDGSTEQRELRFQIAEISEELIARLAAEPELLYRLSPRRFEELVAELYHRRGFETHLTPHSGDRGVDLYVVRHDELGASLSVVQCKRYRPGNRVGPGLVRELQGAMVGVGATAGVLLTTSFFTPGARALESQFRYQLSLQDYYALLQLLSLPSRPHE